MSATANKSGAVESALVFSGWALGTFLTALMAWVLVPTLALGWTPLLITSNSMAPSIRAGDVVIADPGSDDPDIGEVVAFDGDGSTVVHRVHAREDDRRLVTKGDANVRPDSTTIGAEDLVGSARLLVPYVGMLRLMGWGPVLIALVLAAVAAVAWRRVPLLAAGCALAVGAIATMALASAQFTTAGASTGNSIATVDLAAPTDLTAMCGTIGFGEIEVDLSWNASTSPGVTGFTILRDAPGGGTNYSEVGTSVATSFTDAIPASLLSLGTHHYAVIADSGSWQSELSVTDAVVITQALGVYVCTES